MQCLFSVSYILLLLLLTVYMIVQTSPIVGIQNLLSLFEAILSDVSILFVSSSFVRLVDAQMGLISIIFPLELG